MNAPAQLSVGDVVRFPAEVHPWSSGVLRNRQLTIPRGATAEVLTRPQSVGRRGYMVWVRIKREDVIANLRNHDLNDVLRLRVSLKEVERV